MENKNYRFRATKAVLEIRFESGWPYDHYRLYVNNEPQSVTHPDPEIVLSAAWCGNSEHDFFRRLENVEEIPFDLKKWESISQ